MYPMRGDDTLRLNYAPPVPWHRKLRVIKLAATLILGLVSVAAAYKAYEPINRRVQVMR
jgi:hypothetical protein